MFLHSVPDFRGLRMSCRHPFALHDVAACVARQARSQNRTPIGNASVLAQVGELQKTSLQSPKTYPARKMSLTLDFWKAGIVLLGFSQTSAPFAIVLVGTTEAVHRFLHLRLRHPGLTCFVQDLAGIQTAVKLCKCTSIGGVGRSLVRLSRRILGNVPNFICHFQAIHPHEQFSSVKSRSKILACLGN